MRRHRPRFLRARKNNGFRAPVNTRSKKTGDITQNDAYGNDKWQKECRWNFIWNAIIINSGKLVRTCVVRASYSVNSSIGKWKRKRRRSNDVQGKVITSKYGKNRIILTAMKQLFRKAKRLITFHLERLGVVMWWAMQWYAERERERDIDLNIFVCVF